MSRLDPTLIISADRIAHQTAALCWRRRGERVQVLLITSRDTGRWVLPKGWPMAGRAPHEAAAQEAWEEAGVRGVVNDRCIGLFTYLKQMETKDDLTCLVEVYPLKVTKVFKTFPEKGQRKLKWQDPARAANRVDEQGLAALLAGFDPDHVPTAASDLSSDNRLANDA